MGTPSEDIHKNFLMVMAGQLHLQTQIDAQWTLIEPLLARAQTGAEKPADARERILKDLRQRMLFSLEDKNPALAAELLRVMETGLSHGR